MKKYIQTFRLFLLAILFVPQMTQAQVITNDSKELITLAKQVYNDGNGLIQSLKSLQQTVIRAIDLGAYMDTFFDVSFLIPKPQMSSDVVNAVPKENSNSSLGGSTGVGVSEGTSSSGSNQQFESSSKVKASVANNMQVTDASSASGSDGSDIEGVVSDITGGDVSHKAKSDEVSKKRAQLSRSKQAFARYALATALVHRTLAHRTFEDTKEETKEQAAKTTTIRETHTGKSKANMSLSDTFNRLLMSQAAANGLSAFAAMDDMESKIDFNLRGITDGLAGGTGGMSGSLGGLIGN